VTALDPLLAPELAAPALLVIDMQRDFAEGGASPVPGTAAVVPSVARAGGRLPRTWPTWEFRR
jgi:nicotinamidase-related amidase